MSEPVAVQIGLFGGTTVLEDWHVVSAHTRVLPDGTETFVSEHLRWNRGRQASPTPSVRLPEAPPDHPSLFDPPNTED